MKKNFAVIGYGGQGGWHTRQILASDVAALTGIYDIDEKKAELAEKNGISCQTKSRIAGGNDSGAIHVSRGGVRTLAISLPCRYLHSPSCLADLNDLDACTALLPLLVKSIMEEVSTI